MITLATFRRPRRNRADEVSITDDLRKVPADDRPLGELVEPVPSFTPVDPLRETGQMEAVTDFALRARPYADRNADPLAPRVPVPLCLGPAIGDAMPVPRPAAPGASVAPYTGPGWARMLAASRLANPGRDERDRRLAEARRVQVDQGLGRNAAEFQTENRHSREKIALAARQYCAGIGRPDLAGTLLDLVQEMNVAAASSRLAGRAA